MSNNYWPLVAPILAAAGVLLAGPIASIVQGIFRKPEQTANTTDQATSANMKLLEQNQLLAKSNYALMKSNARLDRKLSEIGQELRTTREVMRLFLDVVERATPALRKAGADNMPELTHAMSLARTALNGNGEHK